MFKLVPLLSLLSPLHVFGLPYPDNPLLIGLHNISDVVIGIAYVTIAATIARLVHRAYRAIPFSWMFLAFGAFILGCGISHFMHVVTVWHPEYWPLLAAAQAVTVVASFVTAALLPSLVPRALALLESAQFSERRKAELQRINTVLEAQIAEHTRAREALHASEARQRTILEALHEGVVLHDDTGQIVEANPAAERLLGLTGDQLHGLTARDPRWRSLHEDGRPYSSEEHPSTVALRTGVAQEQVVMGVHTGDGTLRWFAVTAQPLADPEGGRPRGVVSSFVDLTARKEVELALRASEARFRGAFEHGAIGKVIVGLDGRWLRVNHALCTLLGHTEEELLGVDSRELTHPDDLAAGIEPVRQLLTGETEGYQLEKRYRHRAGHWVWTLLSASLVRDEAGVPEYFISQIQDISARMDAEAGQREAAESFADLFAASEAITINEGGRVVAVNPAYTALLGWESADVVGRLGTDLVVSADRPASAARVAANDERTYTVELWRKDGTTVPVEVVGRAIRYEGRPARLATLRDVTDRARAEAALRASEERFRTSFEHAAIGKALVAPDGRWLRVNRALCALLETV